MCRDGENSGNSRGRWRASNLNVGRRALVYRVVKEGVEALDLGPGERDGFFAEEDGAEGGLGYR